MVLAARVSILLLLVGLTASCGDATAEAPPVQIASTYAAVQSLEMLAAEVRAANGWVFRGAIQGAPTGIAAERVRATGEYWVEYPQAQVAVTVVDPMGSMAPATVTLHGRRGPLRVVDAQGAPVHATTSDDPRLPWRAVPGAGEYVFFVIPQPQGVTLLRWRAEVHNGMVSGQGTQSATDLPLAALALPQTP